MKRKNASRYKEGVVKTVWNVSAKRIQEKYFKEYSRKMDPFKDLVFEGARKARTTKRKQLQSLPENRKNSSTALTSVAILKISQNFDENTSKVCKEFFFKLHL